MRKGAAMKLLWAMAAVAGLLAADSANAQLARNSSAPIDITADEAEVVNSQCLAIWRGAAEALQDRTRLRADTITLTGGVIIVQGKNVARGERLVVNVETGQAEMTSSARGRGNPNRVRGVFYPSGETPAGGL